MKIIFWMAVSAVFAFLMLPLIIVVVSSFSEGEIIQFPPNGFTFRWFSNLFGMEIFKRALALSLVLALSSTTLAISTGTICAYCLTRFKGLPGVFLEWFILSPLLVPEIVVGFSLLSFSVRIMKSANPFLILLVGHTLILIPYTTRIIWSSLRNLDPSLEESAVNLGATRLKAFLDITLPNLKSALLSSFALDFIASFNNVPISLFLVNPGYTTLPIQLLIYSEYYFDPTVSAVSTVMLLLTLILLSLVEKGVKPFIFISHR